MKSILKKIILLFVMTLGFGGVKAEGKNVLDIVEKTSAMVTIPSGLATHYAFQSKRSAALAKAVDDVLVIFNRGISLYNKSLNDTRDLSYFKVLDAVYRMRDLSHQVRYVANGTQETVDTQTEATLKKLSAVAFSLVQSGARTYGAFYKQEDTDEARKMRYWVDAVAFIANRLSDLATSSEGLSAEDFEYQVVGTVAGFALLAAYAPERFGFEAVAEGAKDLAKDLADKAHGALKVGARQARKGVRKGMRMLQELL